MENFAPGLRDSILTLTEAFQFVLFFICIVGLILQVNHARVEQDSLLQPIVRAIVVVGLISTLPQWFELLEKLFLALAELIHEGYTEHPMRAAVLMRDSIADSASDFSFQRIGESLYRATLFAAAKLIVLLGSLLQLPFLVLQFILKLLCYLFLPVALALFMVPSLASLGTRYMQQTLAVLSWPVGFAITELVAYHLLTAYATNLAAAYDLAPGQIDAASFASLLGGLLAALWLLIGTLGTPFLMQALLCSGAPLSGGSSSALQQLYAIHQLSWVLKTVKTGGAAALGAVFRGAGSAGRGGTPPPSAPPAAAVPHTTPPAPSGGSHAAAALLAAMQPQKPRTGI